MLWFSVGTAAELIKIYPILHYASKRNLQWTVLATGQSGVNIIKQWEDFGLHKDHKLVFLDDAPKDLETSSSALKWFSRSYFKNKSQIISRIHFSNGPTPRKGDFWLVHGDTLSTLIGARYAKSLNITLAHLEAGLRSPSLFNPFPEEINRRIVSRYADIHFPQDETAVNNLRNKHVKGKIICTGANTLFDTIKLILKDNNKSESFNDSFIVANIHRFENLNNAYRWNKIIKILIKASELHPLKLILHPQTSQKLKTDPFASASLAKARIEMIDRLPFSEFIRLLANSQFIISDGGSNQEECFYLGKACLILRSATERQEGLGYTSLLSKFDDTLIDNFFVNPSAYSKNELKLNKSPSAVVLDELSIGST